MLIVGARKRLFGRNDVVRIVIEISRWRNRNERRNHVRDYESAYGQCRIALPKKMADQWDVRRLNDLATKTQREFIRNEDQIKDTDRCDLQRPDGKVYIVQRRVG